MSQADQTAYKSGDEIHQHGENAQFEAKFGLSWRDLEMDAKLNTVGTAVSEGSEKLETFMQKLVELTKVIVVAVVAIFCVTVAKVLIKSKL